MQERYVSSPHVNGGLMLRCPHPRRRVSQLFGLDVCSGIFVRPWSGTVTVFNCLHEDSRRKAMRRLHTISRSTGGLWASGNLGNSRGAEKGASEARFVNTLRHVSKLVKQSNPEGAGAGRGGVTSHPPFAAGFLRAFFSPASFSTSPG